MTGVNKKEIIYKSVTYEFIAKIVQRKEKDHNEWFD